jgi:hypothetical protein
MRRHRHTEWLKFLRLIERSVEAGKEIHIIADNYATHKHAAVQRWLDRHPRFHVHFTPTGSSWLNMVERFFRDLTVNRIRRGHSQAFPISKPLSTIMFASTTATPSRSFGPSPPRTSFRRSPAPEPPRINADLNDALH